jgi:hypothetical protein
MPERKSLVALCVLVFAFALLGHAQDDPPPPSLGDVARQARQQKQQKDAPSQVANVAAKPEGPADSKDNASATDASGNALTPVAQTNPTTSNKDAQTGVAQNKDAPDKNKDKGSPAAAGQPSSSKPAKHVITNDEIPSSGGPTGYRPPLGPRSSNDDPSGDGQPAANGPKYPAAYWTQQILAQKNTINSLESQIAQLSDSIQYAGANCVSNCVQWNERQKQKQDQVDGMKQQLDDAQKHLEELQDGARQQGYGSSVYDP